MVGKNKNVTKTHRHRLLKATCVRGIAAAGSYLPSKLREGSWHCQRHSNKIEKAAVRKHWKWWGEKCKGGESSPTLPSPRDLQAGDGSGGLLITLSTEGGRRARPTE